MLPRHCCLLVQLAHYYLCRSIDAAPLPAFLGNAKNRHSNLTLSKPSLEAGIHWWTPDLAPLRAKVLSGRGITVVALGGSVTAARASAPEIYDTVLVTCSTPAPTADQASSHRHVNMGFHGAGSCTVAPATRSQSFRG